MLYPLIDVFNDLAINGIIIEVEGKQEKVYFEVSLILGDNLGVNGVLGLTKSFKSSFFCRNCTRSSTQTKEDICEFETSYRNKENYEKSLSILDVQERISKTGITENFSYDIMHDFFKGVCHYNLCNILQYYIKKKFYFRQKKCT